MENQTILNNKLIADLDAVIKEGIQILNERTGTKINSYRVIEDKIELLIDEVNSMDEKHTVLKDRLGIKEETNSVTNNTIDKFKYRLDTILKDDFRDYTIKFKALDNTGDIIFIYLEVNIPTIPYSVKVNFKLYEDEFIDMGYMLFGAEGTDEKWTATSIDSQRFIEVLKSIKAYYLSKNELSE